MRYNEREAIVRLLQEIEEKFPVHEWKLLGVHFWPVLKMNLFSDEYNKQNRSIIETKSSGSNLTWFHRAVKKMYNLVRTHYALYSLKLKPSRVVFSGAPSHRVSWQGQEFNRFFDPMMDYLEDRKIESYLFEYKRLPEKQIYKGKRVLDLTLLMPCFYRRINLADGWNLLKKEGTFLEFLEVIRRHFGLDENQMRMTITNLLSRILAWKGVFAYVFEMTNPAYAFGLCYYSSAMYGMNLAAHDRKIISVDMQHGTQGNFHPAYVFSRLPAEGYNVLPQQFWCWDAGTLSSINQWLTKHQYHKAVLSGNPWISLLQNGKFNYLNLTSNLPLILYTLQPIEPVIDEYMLDVIEATANKYQWWLRLHPRQSIQDKDQLQERIAERGLHAVVEIEAATNTPLPLILGGTSLHISKYSGAIAEAAMLNTTSLILGRIGTQSFSNLIVEGMAFGIEYPDFESVKESIDRLINAKARLANLSNVHFKTVLHECIR